MKQWLYWVLLLFAFIIVFQYLYARQLGAIGFLLLSIVFLLLSLKERRKKKKVESDMKAKRIKQVK